ncbi:MAG: chromosome segregation protein SMC [Alphaproteobacteria bacterium]|nr:chromosome segregation protein SMC [Alphaproteobacteria bacterium]
MVQIQRLRLSGFKSFVDKTELDIGDGLNGIVGPNGCGKSNLVEALRWVMGENRAKNMRSGDMEDVIFAGTSARPARSIAEVTLTLDNADGTAPHPFGGAAQIEVTRRIERDKGSKYLVNGKEVRARDVQMLFADALTGAHSPALVSQGRVTQLIQAKPSERRQMLEESAGVASLYTRRHEAELRLKAAEENLSKLDLVINELGNRANSLRNQAKSATRYRELSESIRKLESLLAWQDWGSTRDKLKKEETRHTDTDAQLREAMLKTSELTRAAAEAAEAVEGLRIGDAEARAALQLLRQALEQLEREANHRRTEHNDIIRQMSEAEADLRLATEQRDALADRASVIAADLDKISSEDAENPTGLGDLERDYAQAQEAVRFAENDVLAHQDKIRKAKSEREQAQVAATRAEAEAKRLAARLADIEAQYAAAMVQGTEEQELATLVTAIEDYKAKRAEAEGTLADKQAAFDAARDGVNAARDALQTLQQDKGGKQRELKSLTDLIARLSQGFEGSYILALDIPAEYAVAVSAAAGEAALRAEEGQWGQAAEGFAASDWPQGVTPLASVIEAPAALQAFVSSVAIVDAEKAASLQAQLKRGQVLVSKEGQIWRWDGLSVSRSADSESRIFTLRAQIKECEAALAAIDPAIASAQETLNIKNTERDTLQAACATLQQQVREYAGQLQSAERKTEQLQKVVNDRVVKRSLLEGQRDQAREAAKGAEDAMVAASAAYAVFENTDAEAQLANDLRAAEEILTERRARRDGLSGQIEAIKAAALQAKQLLERLRNEAKRTDEQIARVKAQAESLTSRLEALSARKETLDPQIAQDEAGTARDAILTRITDAEAKAAEASDGFAVADAKAKSLAQELKKSEEEGIGLRERRAVIAATIQALQGEQERIANDIQERFSCSPSMLENAVMSEWAEAIPSQSKARSERDFLNRERDDMGPVNLRAEVELEEATTEQTRLETEKADLTAAIERLREGIAVLNGEARERLVKTFEQVNAHFQRLFQRLFGGGEAHLKLIDSEDPLDAGLEIFAQPPGKALQSLSLLSGGEQTLTAISMIFAMFLANPAPVCVLDEVDAPLDDANVDRVCTLLEEMSASCSTRFLIISHHRMTMARMHRLYGVTMAERGISQLVSVNLAAQGDLLAHIKAA